MRTGQWSANHPLFHHKTFSLVTYLFKQLDILREPNPIQHSLDTFVQMRQLDETDHQAIGNVEFGEFLGIVCRVCQEFATLREREADVSAFERLLELLLKRTHVVITRKDALQFIQKRFHTKVGIEITNGVGQPFGVLFEALCERSRNKDFCFFFFLETKISSWFLERSRDLDLPIRFR